ncbi:MAG: BamA/TamA family outer membrane protein, partial [Hyphomicrobiales bacterium]|nr:BamA/TamA family outer membrane protein [Hyphomicrobiales bacterium]
LFVDFGWIGETDAIETAPAGAPRNIQDEFAFRASYGLSIAWRSPLGPVRFDLARAVRRQPYDDTRFFNFSIGASL